MGRIRRTAVVLTGIAVAVIGAGGVMDVFSADPAVAAELPAFSSCPALQSWVDRAAADEAEHPIYPMELDRAGGAASSAGVPSNEIKAAAPAAAARGASGASGQDAVGSSATGTNVQEAGVDEPDEVKTDGHYVVGIGDPFAYDVSNDRSLWVATVSGHVPTVLSHLRLDGAATSLLLAGRRALVLVQPNEGYPVARRAAGGPGAASAPDRAVSPAPVVQTSRLEVVELSDPSHPHVIAKETVTGSILTARQVGDVAWVVTQSQPRELIEPGLRAPLLPHKTVTSASGVTVADGNTLPCSAVRHPTTLSGSGLLTVQPVPITASEPFQQGRSAGVIATGSYVYASATRLYVATNGWNNNATTQIHAFDISKPATASYVGTGSVRGTLLSQWAMSEQDGYLRVASTTGAVVPAAGEGAVPLPGQRSVTSITVLAERGDRLAQVGHVGGLGRGERVFAVRYLGNLAAVVTFRQTDPLYLVDLSQPSAPRVRGALELTGFSSYLHPVGNGLLLGIGREADVRGHLLDAKATLFGISDLAHPKQLSSVRLGDAWSEVDGDTHAFTYLPNQHVALIPTSDAIGARSVLVDGTHLLVTGNLATPTPVQRFLPFGAELLGAGPNTLLDVDPISLDVLGQTPLV